MALSLMISISNHSTPTCSYHFSSTSPSQHAQDIAARYDNHIDLELGDLTFEDACHYLPLLEAIQDI